MKLVLSEPRFLKDSILMISEIVNDVQFKVDKNAIQLIAMDPANVAMVIFKLLSSSFIEYSVEGEKEIAISLDSLKQVLKRAKPNDMVILELDETKNRLKLQLKGESTRTFSIGLIDIEKREQKIPDLKFPAKVELNTLVFDEAISDMDIVSDSVLLQLDPEKFTVQASGNISEGKVEIKKDENTIINLSKDNTIKAKYSIEYLKKIIKASRLADKVTIQFDKDYPLKADYKVIDKLQLSVILAPRVETG